jgi:flagellar basal-body rod modification protein FlgD
VVTFTLSKEARVEVKVKNSDGVVVNAFTKNNLFAGVNTITWDGKDFVGNIVKDGSYTIGMTAIDSDGNRSLLRHSAVMVYY